MEKFITVLWITFIIYALVLLAILFDLWSGVRKAKKNGITRTSYGFRRTVDKLSRYYNVLLALTVVDTMQIISLWYLEKYYAWHWPIFPFITLIGGVGVCLIEIKSIYEKAEDKIKIAEVSDLAGNLIKNRESIEAIAKTIMEYLNKPEQKPTT